VQCLSEAILIRRQSTRTVKAGGARYVAALDYIRSKACDGIGVDDVVKFLGVSRRSAERAFRRFVGRTILEEISDVRYQKACCLLKDPTRTLDGLYAECGYRDNISFRRFFRNKAGVSLGEWRKKHS
jgi:LacI family transcriptional regulator